VRPAAGVPVNTPLKGMIRLSASAVMMSSLFTAVSFRARTVGLRSPALLARVRDLRYLTEETLCPRL
jgi:hypothetical protein